MRRTFVLSLLSVTAFALIAARRRAVSPSELEPSLSFTFDSGYRVIGATNPAAGVAPDGSVVLYYTDQTTNLSMRAAARDGLSFSNPTAAHPADYGYDSRNTLMPDGKTWRRYQLDPRTATVTSLRSNDGMAFTSEPGTRYTAQPQDHGTIGVYDAFSDQSGGVVFLYLGDMLGLNNVRRAYSRDNGLTFTFERGNVLGDDNAGGGPQSFVDEKTIRLSDGRIRLFTMRQNELHQTSIYSFISNDDGFSFNIEPGPRLLFTNFKDGTLTSLNDPVCVRLADGRYRIYVASLRSDKIWVIVSATSR